MALAATSLFASFDVTDGAQERDISPLLQRAIYYDLNALGALNVQFDNPVHDTTHYWNEEALNSDTVQASVSMASNATSLSLTTGHGARIHIGDLIYDLASGTTEIMQITAITTDVATITRTYNTTVATSNASNASFGIIRAEQEASDIGSDKTLNPTVRSNFTQIVDTYDLQISGSQLERRMATNEYQDRLKMSWLN